MRKKRVALKHHRRAAMTSPEICNVIAADANNSGGRCFMPCNHPQKRGFPATTWPDQATIGTAVDLQIKIIDRFHGAKTLGQLLD